MPAWSYSSIKTFEQCPKKYYHTKVLKDFKDEPGEEAIYGTMLHEAAELYFKDGKEIPEKFGFIKGAMERLAGLEGEKHAELKLGLRKTTDGFEGCGFSDKDVWWRGIADLLVINEAKGIAWCVDHKSGKSTKYADKKQLDLLAGAVFVHYPTVRRVNSALLFVVAEEVIDKVHVRENMEQYLGVFDGALDRLDAAHENDKWSANSGPLCGWCPVKACPHWRDRRR